MPRHQVYSSSAMCDNCGVSVEKAYGFGPKNADHDVLCFCLPCLKIHQEKHYFAHVKKGNVQDEMAVKFIKAKEKYKKSLKEFRHPNKESKHSA